MWQAGVFIDKIGHERGAWLNKAVVKALYQRSVLAGIVVLANHEDHHGSFIFLDGELFTAAMQQRVPGTTNGTVGLIFMSQVAVAVHSAPSKLKKVAGFIVDTKTN